MLGKVELMRNGGELLESNDTAKGKKKIKKSVEKIKRRLEERKGESGKKAHLLTTTPQSSNPI